MHEPGRRRGRAGEGIGGSGPGQVPSGNAPVDDPKRPGEVEIVDFSKARNRALRLATQPYVMWLDSDYTLEGGEHLADVCAKMAEAGQDMVRVLMPYLYDTDPSAGVVTRVQWRERIVIHPEQFHWVRPCHEGLVPRVGYPAAVDIHENRLAVRHHVDATHHARSVARNERIFRRWVKTHPKAADDPRILFDWGMSLADLGERGEAAESLTRYMGMSGRVDQTTQAALKFSASPASSGISTLASDGPTAPRSSCRTSSSRRSV